MKQGQPFKVTRALDPGVDQAPRQRALAGRVQVHEGESDVIDDIDAT